MAKKKNLDDLTEEVVKEEGAAVSGSGAKGKGAGGAVSATARKSAVTQEKVGGVNAAQSTAVKSAPMIAEVKKTAPVQSEEYAPDEVDVGQDTGMETPKVAKLPQDTLLNPLEEKLTVAQPNKAVEYQPPEDRASDDEATTGASIENALAELTARDAAQASQTVHSKTDAEKLLADYSYAESDAVSAANQALKDYLTTEPDEYTSSYQEQIDGLLDKILNREDFVYDFDADPLYQQYKNRYEHNAQLAMQDTMAQAQMATGGYGSSYATQAASGAYQDEINQLTREMPELYHLAYGLYSDKGNEMRDNLSALTDQEAAAQALYQDLVDNYYTGLSAATDAAENAYDKDYGQYEDTRDYLQDLMDYYAGQEQQSVENKQAQREYELAVKKYEQSVRQWEETQNQWWTKYNASQAASNQTTNITNNTTNNTSNTSAAGTSKGEGEKETFTLSPTARDLQTMITQEMRNYAAKTGETVSSKEIAAQVKNILKSYERNYIITEEEANFIGRAYDVKL